jgi:hypothetical protein
MERKRREQSRVWPPETKSEAPGAPDPASLGEDRKSRAGAPGRKDQVEGEGSYTGTKDYNQRTKKFIESGKVEDAARKASPQSEEDARAMQKAERVGKQRAKGEDPALRDPKKIKDDPNFPRK